jgi:hypothetical protein
MAKTPFTVADEPPTAATRHLCAGAYLDREFRDMVLAEVRHDASRRVSPSYGFDIIPVVQHAWRAWWLETTGQLWMLTLLAVALAVDISAVITAACAWGICYLGRCMVRRAPEFTQLRANRLPPAGCDDHCAVATVTVTGSFPACSLPAPPGASSCWKSLTSPRPGKGRWRAACWLRA